MLKGLWKRLTAGSGVAAGPAESGEAVDYKGYRIRPAPYSAEGQFQTAGTIEKDFPSGVKSYRFVRAEKHTSKDGAAEFAITKGRQIVDEQGERMFDAT